MRAHAIAVVSVLLVAGVGQTQTAQKEAAKRELQRLQGSWRVETSESNGDKTPVSELKDRTVFIGSDILLDRDGKKIIQIVKLKLDPTKTPKTINATILKGENKGDVMLGIYELKGDTFRICFDPEGQNRPKEFKTTPKSGQFMVECKRIPPPDQKLPDITGEYKSESMENEGGRLTAEVTIERFGDVYQVTYRKNGLIAYIGIGIRRGDTFSLCWGANNQVGLSVYQIEKGRLVGQYTQLGNIGMLSQEVLTPKDKSD